MKPRRIVLAGALALAAGTALGEEAPRAPAVDAAPDVTMPTEAHAVASYTLTAKLDPVAHAVHGEGSIVFTNTSKKEVRDLWLHLYMNAFKNQRSVFMRAPVGGFRGATMPATFGTIDVRRLFLRGEGDTGRELWPDAELRRPGDDDETDAHVPLPRSVAPGESVTLDVVWDVQLPSIVERTGFDGSFHMVAQWFPKLAKLEDDGHFAHFPFHHLGEFYADYGSYDVTVDVPESFILGATGAATETRIENGRRIERHTQSSIHDFAFTAWDRFDAREENVDGVAVKVLYPRGMRDMAARELEAVRFALPHFGARYGRYPYPVLTVVHPPERATEAGGMEYPTLITTGAPAMLPRGVRAAEIVTVHELGHQWFYGLLASHETKWPFLDEGLNSYAETDAMAAWKGAAGVVDLAGFQLDVAAAHQMRAFEHQHDERIAQPAWAFATGSAYGALIYSRTAVLLETMRRVHGDAAMQRALGVYARRFRFAHPTPEDFLGVMAETLGPEAAKTLRTALFDKGWVDYAILQTSSHAQKVAAGIFDVAGKRETVSDPKVTPGMHEGWVLVTRRGTLSFPVDVELVFEDGSRKRVPWDGLAETTRIPFSGSSGLRFAVVDPDGKIAIDADPTNNATTRGGSGAAPRTLERVTYVAELLLQGLGP